MSSQARKDQKRDARIAAEHAALNLPPPGSASGKEYHAVAQSWCEDFTELADAIADPRQTVTNRDRDTLAKGLPRGAMTDRDGNSVRPVYNEEK